MFYLNNKNSLFLNIKINLLLENSTSNLKETRDLEKQLSSKLKEQILNKTKFSISHTRKNLDKIYAASATVVITDKHEIIKAIGIDIEHRSRIVNDLTLKRVFKDKVNLEKLIARLEKEKDLNINLVLYSALEASFKMFCNCTSKSKPKVLSNINLSYDENLDIIKCCYLNLEGEVCLSIDYEKLIVVIAVCRVR